VASLDIGSASRQFTEDEKVLVQSLIDDVHAQFVEAISLGRKMSVEDVVKLADGRIYSGRQALKVGLVDELGNLQDAVDYAAELTGLGEDPSLVYPRPQKKEFFERFLDNSLSRFGTELMSRQSPGLQYLWPGF